MKHDIVMVMKKHIDELFQILIRYDVADRQRFVSVGEADMAFQKAVLMSVGYVDVLSKKLAQIKRFPEYHFL